MIWFYRMHFIIVPSLLSSLLFSLPTSLPPSLFPSLSPSLPSHFLPFLSRSILLICSTGKGTQYNTIQYNTIIIISVQYDLADRPTDQPTNPTRSNSTDLSRLDPTRPLYSPTRSPTIPGPTRLSYCCKLKNPIMIRNISNKTINYSINKMM